MIELPSLLYLNQVLPQDGPVDCTGKSTRDSDVPAPPVVKSRSSTKAVLRRAGNGRGVDGGGEGGGLVCFKLIIDDSRMLVHFFQKAAAPYHRACNMDEPSVEQAVVVVETNHHATVTISAGKRMRLAKKSNHNDENVAPQLVIRGPAPAPPGGALAAAAAFAASRAA